MYKLLRTGIKFVWGVKCQAAFKRVKRALSTSEVLVHYSLEMPLVLTADTSAAGVGAVSCIPHSRRRTFYRVCIANAYRRRTSDAQIDREALVIIHGTRTFHQYLCGRNFLLRTGHKPLTYIYGNKVGIPVMIASRLERWAILLTGNTYDLKY